MYATVVGSTATISIERSRMYCESATEAGVNGLANS